MLGDYEADEVLLRGFVACGATQDEAEKETERFLSAIDELLAKHKPDDERTESDTD